jgi:dipeptidyl aminopeptidase/acylaminoacyl peptidase
METTRLLHTILAAAAALAASAAVLVPASPAVDELPASTRTVEIPYTAHDGSESHATVLLPASYDGGPLPLVISPHGRGLHGDENARLWGDLPGRLGFAVVNPDGEGAHLSGRFSWGAPGQIDDLARMPEIVEAALPDVHIDRTRIYAVGGSMGGQETLLLIARYPHLLAGAVAVDPAVDFAMQYENFHEFECSEICRSSWNGFIGDKLQSFARREIGGSPDDVPAAYAERSPITYTEQIAKSNVPLALWWSRTDEVIRHSELQSGLLAEQLRHDGGTLQEVVGAWRHTHPLRYDRELPAMLAELGIS